MHICICKDKGKITERYIPDYKQLGLILGEGEYYFYFINFYVI